HPTFNTNSNSFEFDSLSNILDDLDSNLPKNQEFSNELLNNSSYSDDIQNSSSDNEINQKHDEFPNKAYADLMILHSNHSTLPLPKNIKQGKEFMNNIKFNLEYKKTKVLDFDNT
ncbi:13977_t:CDS:2, partial [Ambispora leptoticha]